MSWWRLQLCKWKLDSSAPEKRIQAVDALGRLATPAVGKMLVRIALIDEDASVRAAAIDAMRRLDDAAVVKPLMRALHEERLRQEGIEALGQLPALAAEPLMADIGNCDHDSRDAIVKALTRMGKAAVPVLLSGLKDGNMIVRAAAKEALRDIGYDPNAPPPPKTEESQPKEARTHRSADALKQLDHLLGGSSAAALPPEEEPAVDPVQACVNALMSPEVEERLEAVQVLRDVGGARAMKLLSVALQDETAVVRQEAVQALDALGWAPASPQHRAQRAIALGQFEAAAAEGGGAIEPLIAALQDGESHDAALDALARIVEESAAELDADDLRAVAAVPALRDFAEAELQRRGA